MITSTQSAVTFTDVTFQYEQEQEAIPILNKLNLDIFRGEFVSIVGASGSGKSTIFRLITGLEQANDGVIFINKKVKTNRLGQTGYMPQQDLLLPWRTIRQNAALALEVKNLKEPQLIDNLLQDFGLAGYEDKFPHELSGGMRQRVSFLRATLSGSNILLLDEPFSALDAMTKLFMQEWLLEKWAEQQSTILFITHDISEALFLSDRILVVSETPITKMEEFIVPLVRPRKQQDLNQQAVLALKNELIERFRMRQDQ